jgi:hypothetical protein
MFSKLNMFRNSVLIGIGCLALAQPNNIVYLFTDFKSSKQLLVLENNLIENDVNSKKNLA